MLDTRMERHNQFASIGEEVVRILDERNAKYGDAFVTLGLRGIFAAIHGKYERLRTVVWEDQWNGDKAAKLPAIRDTHLDIAGYAILGLVLLDNPELLPPSHAVPAPVWRLACPICGGAVGEAQRKPMRTFRCYWCNWQGTSPVSQTTLPER